MYGDAAGTSAACQFVTQFGEARFCVASCGVMAAGTEYTSHLSPITDRSIVMLLLVADVFEGVVPADPTETPADEANQHLHPPNALRMSFLQ